MCWLSWHLGASTCWNPHGLSRPVIALPFPFSNIIAHFYVWHCNPFWAVAFLRRHLHSSLSLILCAENQDYFLCVRVPFEASLRFSRQKYFYWVKLSVSRPIPNLEDQGILFLLGHQLSPLRRGIPCQELGFDQHRSQDPLTTQAPPLRQSREAFGGSDRTSSSKVWKFKVPLYPGTYCKYFHNVSRWGLIVTWSLLLSVTDIQ